MTSWSQRLKVNRTRPLRRRTWTNVHKHPQVQKEDKAIFLMCQSCSAWALRVSCGQVTDWEETKESSVTNYVLDKWSGALNVTKDTAQVHSPMFSLTCGLDDRVCMHQRGGGRPLFKCEHRWTYPDLAFFSKFLTLTTSYCGEESVRKPNRHSQLLLLVHNSPRLVSKVTP